MGPAITCLLFTCFPLKTASDTPQQCSCCEQLRQLHDKGFVAWGLLFPGTNLASVMFAWLPFSSWQAGAALMGSDEVMHFLRFAI